MKLSPAENALLGRLMAKAAQPEPAAKPAAKKPAANKAPVKKPASKPPVTKPFRPKTTKK